MMMIFSLFNWIKITTCIADSMKVGFNNGVAIAYPFHLASLRPGICQHIVLEHLQSCIKHNINQPRDTSSLELLPSHPPTTITCWFKWTAPRPYSVLGKLNSHQRKNKDLVWKVNQQCIFKAIIMVIVMWWILCVDILHVRNYGSNFMYIVIISITAVIGWLSWQLQS